MHKNTIENTKIFQIYIGIRLVVSILTLFAWMVLFSRLAFKDFFTKSDVLSAVSGEFLLILLLFIFGIYILFNLFEYFVKPYYIEVSVSEQQMEIKYFRPLFRHLSDAVLRLRYKKRLRTLILSKSEYGNYSLTISKCGFRKTLKLQKVTPEGIFETPEINIGFLGQKKYTDLVLSIDRMTNKINLN